jgi:lipooligosaccharide transport system permease protein
VLAALLVVEHNGRTFRRTWRSALASFVSPFMLLAAMGLGLGSLVDRQRGGVDGVNYITFLAPGLLAATAMQLGSMLGAWPIMARIRWDRIYLSMLASPLGIDQVLLGELAWMAIRLLLTTAVFLAAMAAFGTVHTPLALLTVPAGVLTGLAFAAPVTALTALLPNESGYNLLFRLGITPLFLLGGAFFPADRLPLPLQVVAWITPLFHGVSLSRGVALARLGPGMAALHVAVLLAFIVVGYLLARVTFTRKLRQ